MQRIPLSNNPNQQFSIVLNDQNCVITLRQIAQQVYASLSVDQEVVFETMACRDRMPLPIFSTTKFSGRLMFIDIRGRENPNYEGFNDRFVLVYLTDEEAEAWQ